MSNTNIYIHIYDASYVEYVMQATRELLTKKVIMDRKYLISSFLLKKEDMKKTVYLFLPFIFDLISSMEIILKQPVATQRAEFWITSNFWIIDNEA